MSGWDAVRRVSLAEPWQDFWIDGYLDPEIGLYLDMRAASADAVAVPTEASLDALIATMPPLIAEHNLTGRDGQPIAWQARAMGSRLIRALADALTEIADGGGEAADPLPPRATRRAASRATSSPASRSRSATRSGGSRASSG